MWLAFQAGVRHCCVNINASKASPLGQRAKIVQKGHRSHDLGLCNSIRFLNPPNSSVREKTVVIFGIGRGGTSAISGICRILGVMMPGAHPLKHEWSPFSYIGEEVEPTRTRNKIRWLNDHYQMWGWKSPRDIFSFHRFEPMLRNPHVIIAFRNMLDVMSSSSKWDGIDFASNAIEFGDAFKEICRFITLSRSPIALINYERLCADPAKVIQSIDNWLDANASADARAAAARFITAGGRGYKDVAGSEDHPPLFDQNELDADRAQAQFHCYEKRAAEFTAYNLGMFRDLVRALTIEGELEAKLSAFRAAGQRRRRFDEAALEGVEAVSGDPAQVETAHLDELRLRAKTTELADVEADFVIQLQSRLRILTSCICGPCWLNQKAAKRILVTPLQWRGGIFMSCVCGPSRLKTPIERPKGVFLRRSAPVRQRRREWTSS